MGLWSERDRHIGNLPYGHQKMFGIIRALMTHPKVLLLDEPAARLTLPEIIVSGIPQLVRNNPEVVKTYLGTEDLISQKREVKSHVLGKGHLS